MDDGFTVLDDGVVYVDEGRIAAVLAARSRRRQPASRTSSAVASGGTIYPGLIELHNHLAYNALQLWHVPEEVHQPRPVGKHRDRPTTAGWSAAR